MMISGISRLPLPMEVYSNLFLAGVGNAKIHQKPKSSYLLLACLTKLFLFRCRMSKPKHSGSQVQMLIQERFSHGCDYQCDH